MIKKSPLKLEAIWVKAFGIPLHAWSLKTFRKIGDFGGGFVRTDVDTKNRTHFYWARICVSHTDTVRPNKSELLIGDLKFLISILEDVLSTNST